MDTTWHRARAGGLRYRLALPAPPGPQPLPLVISVHGYTRQPEAHWDGFAQAVTARGAALLVPWFRESSFRQYQQLLRPTRPEAPQRADLALIDAVDGLAARRGLRFARWQLFGHSGGAQFAHRFALAHPGRVGALALSAAGWYTLPLANLPYPYGLAGVEHWLGRPVDLDAFLRLPMRLWVGARDREAQDFLRQDPWLTAWQGSHRLQRARRWARAVREAGAARGRRVAVDLQVLPGTGHDFVACVRAGLADAVLGFFDAATRPSPPCALDVTDVTGVTTVTGVAVTA